MPPPYKHWDRFASEVATGRDESVRVTRSECSKQAAGNIQCACREVVLTCERVLCVGNYTPTTTTAETTLVTPTWFTCECVCVGNYTPTITTAQTTLVTPMWFTYECVLCVGNYTPTITTAQTTLVMTWFTCECVCVVLGITHQPQPQQKPHWWPWRDLRVSVCVLCVRNYTPTTTTAETTKTITLHCVTSMKMVTVPIFSLCALSSLVSKVDNAVSHAQISVGVQDKWTGTLRGNNVSG